MVTRGKEQWVDEIGEEGQKIPTFSYTVRSPRDIMYNMVTIVTNTMLYI